MNDLTISVDLDGPRVIHGLDFDEYRAIDAINASGLKLLERSPAHFQQARLEPHAPTAAQALGTLTHLAILEWDRYQALVRVAPDVDRRTKLGKETAAAFEAECAEIGAIVATAEQDQKARAMRDRVMDQPFARALLADGAAEVTLLWQDPETGLDCKARLDWLCGGHEVIADIKTCSSASEWDFRQAARRYDYAIQSVHYSEGAMHSGLGERQFILIAIESDPPHGVQLFTFDEPTLHAARVRRERAMQRYLECVATGQWPAYPVEIAQIGW
jgi:hypothetical protein